MSFGAAFGDEAVVIVGRELVRLLGESEKGSPFHSSIRSLGNCQSCSTAISARMFFRVAWPESLRKPVRFQCLTVLYMAVAGDFSYRHVAWGTARRPLGPGDNGDCKLQAAAVHTVFELDRKRSLNMAGWPGWLGKRRAGWWLQLLRHRSINQLEPGIFKWLCPPIISLQ